MKLVSVQTIEDRHWPRMVATVKRTYEGNREDTFIFDGNINEWVCADGFSLSEDDRVSLLEAISDAFFDITKGNYKGVKC
ncbi:MAG: hypothetical protein EBU90_26230 [Proteobacteria bacterium]|nr:hypothetical protein [Pseudomonadota bacterium]